MMDLTHSKSATYVAFRMDVETSAVAMVEPDWKAIQERYLAGDDHQHIAEEFGVTTNAIRCRAHRNRWKDQQLKLVESSRKDIGEEIKNCVLISCLREARMFQRLDPAAEFTALDIASRARERLLATTARILDWDSDPLTKAKTARCLDI